MPKLNNAAVNISTPEPRDAVSNAALVRPDWLTSQPRNSDKIWLDKNENLDPILIKYIAGIIATLAPEAIATYPDIGLLYHKLASYLGVSPDSLLMTSGSDAAIASVFQAFISPGDIVVHSQPTFAMYGVYCKIFGARPVTLSYKGSDAGPVLDVKTAASTIRQSRPKLVCLPNPDSPTGAVLTPDHLTEIIRAAGEAGAVMLVDEAYVPFYPETALHMTDSYPHLVVIRSASKSWGLAGIRIGFGVAAPELITILHKIKPMYELGGFAAAVFDRLLDNTEELNASVQRLLDGKKYFTDSMRELGFDVPVTEGNFQLVGFGPRAEAIHKLLADIVYYRQNFSEPCLADYSRFSVTSVDGFQPIVERLKANV